MNANDIENLDKWTGDDWHLICKLFCKELLIFQDKVNLQNIIKYKCNNFLPQIQENEIINYIQSNDYKNQQKLIILLSETNISNNLKDFLVKFIISSKRPVFIRCYLIKFLTKENLTQELQNQILQDIHLHDLYIELLFQNQYLECLKSMIKLNIANKDVLSMIYQNLFYLTQDKCYVNLLKDCITISQYLRFLYKNNIKICTNHLVNVLETFNKSTNIDEIRWIVYWCLKIDILLLSLVKPKLEASNITFCDIFKPI